MNQQLNLRNLLCLIRNDNYLDKIKELITKGADYERESRILTNISLYNNPKTIKYFVKIGCKNQKDMDQTFLNFFYKKNYQMMKFLLDNGANINTDNELALRFSCCERVRDYHLIKFLIDNGASINDVLSPYYTKCDIQLFHLFFECITIDVCNEKKILLDYCLTSKEDSSFEIIKFLIDKGARLDIYFKKPIEWCVSRNNIKIIRLFMEKGDIVSNKAIRLLAEYSKNDSHLEIAKLFYEAQAGFDFVEFDDSNIEINKLISQEFENITFRESDICPISYEKFKEGDEKLGCIKCLNVFKKDILKEWLSRNNICPICRSASRFQKNNYKILFNFLNIKK